MGGRVGGGRRAARASGVRVAERARAILRGARREGVFFRACRGTPGSMDYVNVPTAVFTPLEYGCVGYR